MKHNLLSQSTNHLRRLKCQYNQLINNEEFDRLELGLHQPNIFEILRISKAEVKHSNFLAWILNPKNPHGSTCNWIINKNFFENSDKIHKEALGIQEDANAVIGYQQLINWLYTDTNLSTDEGKEEWRYKRFLRDTAYSRPGNPHITRNMEGTPFRSLKDFDRLNEFEYKFNNLRLPYYLEAKRENGEKEKGGTQISKGDESYSYGDFFRLRVTKYVYRIYKKNALLLGDLAKSNGQQDFGGWNFNLEKSIKSNGIWGNWQEANVLSEGKITPNYYPANQLGLPYYPKGLHVTDGDFDQGSLIDVVMLETDETAKYQPEAGLALKPP